MYIHSLSSMRGLRYSLSEILDITVNIVLFEELRESFSVIVMLGLGDRNIGVGIAVDVIMLFEKMTIFADFA